MPAPDVHNRFAIDVNGDRCAEFLTAQDLVGECLSHFVEARIAVPLEYLVHRIIMRRRARLCSGNCEVASAQQRYLLPYPSVNVEGSRHAQTHDGGRCGRTRVSTDPDGNTDCR